MEAPPAPPAPPATTATSASATSESIELATSDKDLVSRLSSHPSLRGLQYTLPLWLHNSNPIQGDPASIPEWRRQQLRHGIAPITLREQRYVRNGEAIRQIGASLRDQAGVGQERHDSPRSNHQYTAIQEVQSEVNDDLPLGRVDRPEINTRLHKLAVNLAETVLAPFHRKMLQDSDTIDSLQRDNELLAKAYADEKTAHHKTRWSFGSGMVDNGKQSLYEGRKRKVYEEPQDVGNSRDPEGKIAELANEICRKVDRQVPNDTIHLCGLAPLRIIATSPEEVLTLAQEKLHAWPYRKVPVCWRRLYEEASLFKAAKLLRDYAQGTSLPDNASKKQRLEDGSSAVVTKENPDDWLAMVIRVLDMGIALSGVPGRKDTFEAIFHHLDDFVEDTKEIVPARFSTTRPPPLQTACRIRYTEALSFEAFQKHLDNAATPLLMTGVLDHWPAMHLWQKPSHLLRLTLGGRRLVPVEIGKSYTDEGWGQQIMTFNDYMDDYLLPWSPNQIGYLAQHDLFAQIPALREDIRVPDYCHTTPPSSEIPASRSGLPPVAELDEPLLNAWLGPKGTRSPLHTDPYHNILCQVVGYKYIRLYSPEQTPNLYPRGVDESGVNMENTSQVDFAFDPESAENANARIHEAFSKFQEAKYMEAILGPGECLYIPVGWWHYVESLSTSFSVSFWWN